METSTIRPPVKINFKCCKNKPFIHFVCIKCFSVFHKCCLPKLRNQIRFKKDNQIICCNDKINDSVCSDEDGEKSVLEKTINELIEESELKNKYIDKLKSDKNLFVQDPMKTEEELPNLIKSQEKIIDQLKEQLKELNDFVRAVKSKTLKNEGTQINVYVKNMSTSTEIPIEINSGGTMAIKKLNAETQSNCG